VAGEQSEQAVTLLQIFLVITVATALILAANVSQLSDRTQVENALRHQAHHDHLTGLPNRAYLAETLDLAPTATSADASLLTLLVCDIDHLKVVNDTMGHSAGDKLITTIGQCLTDSVRPGDLVARISGDEFVVVLQDVSSTTATELCERIMANDDPVGLHRDCRWSGRF
jgi:GGDEF domain-containing protein